jgi:hypothetical protein
MNPEPNDIRSMSVPLQAAHVALYRLKAARACSPDVMTYRFNADARLLGFSEAVAHLAAAPTPATLNGEVDGQTLVIHLRDARENMAPPIQARLQARAEGRERPAEFTWTAPGRYGPNHSLGLSHDTSTGPLAERARAYGAIACFTFASGPSSVHAWVL